MNIAVMCNWSSDKPADRPELISTLYSMGHRLYEYGIQGAFLHPSYAEHGADFVPIIANRNNTNPFRELGSLWDVKKKIKKYSIGAAVIYGVKNHSAMAIGAKLGGARNIVCVVNGSGNLFRISGWKGRLVRGIALPMLKIAYGVSDYVCFQNRDDMDLFMKLGLVKREEKAFVTNGSGICLEDFPQQPLPEKNIFLFLARITPTKGILEYIEAARIVKMQYPDAEFHVVGPMDTAVEGDQVDRILDSAVAEGIICYHGSTKDVQYWMKKCRFFVYPSYYPEGVPRCGIQAIATGRPIITCDTPGCRETVVDSYNGYGIQPKDPVALADKMVYLIQNPHVAERMAGHSYELAREKFNVYDVNAQLIQRLLEGHE